MSFALTFVPEISMKCSCPGWIFKLFLFIMGKSSGRPRNMEKASNSVSRVPKDTLLEWRSRMILKPLLIPSEISIVSVSKLFLSRMRSRYLDSESNCFVFNAQQKPESVGILKLNYHRSVMKCSCSKCMYYLLKMFEQLRGIPARLQAEIIF